MSQAGLARNDAVVCPNRTGGVEHRVEVGPLRAARQPGSRLIVARSSVESSTLFEVQGAVHTVLQGHQCELLSVL